MSGSPLFENMKEGLGGMFDNSESTNPFAKGTPTYDVQMGDWIPEVPPLDAATMTPAISADITAIPSNGKLEQIRHRREAIDMLSPTPPIGGWNTLEQDFPKTEFEIDIGGGDEAGYIETPRNVMTDQFDPFEEKDGMYGQVFGQAPLMQQNPLFTSPAQPQPFGGQQYGNQQLPPLEQLLQAMRR